MSSILTDKHAIAAALEAGQISRLICCRGKQGDSKLIQMAKTAGVKIKTVVQPAFEREYGSYALVGIQRMIPHHAFKSLDIRADTQILIADHIQDPHNMGALIRSAVSFGYTAFIYATDRQCPITESVIRASAEATAHINIYAVPNIATTVNRLKQQGCWVYGATLDGQPIQHWRPVKPYALVVGHEHNGLSSVVTKLLDTGIAINTPGKTASLNVSVAGGIIMHWAQLNAG